MDNIAIGNLCQTWRKENNIKQSDIASDLDVSVETISAFENGRTNNARVLMWYIEHGLTLS